MVCWWVGPKGAVSGAFAGALVAGTISMGTQAAAAQGLRVPPLNFSKECPSNLTLRTFLTDFVSNFRDVILFVYTLLGKYQHSIISEN